MKKSAKLLKNENGQAAVLAAFMIVALMGFAALSIDLGRAYVTKSNLQKAADAAALAGAKDLPVKTTAESVAVTYAANNGVQTTEVTVTTPYNNDPTKIQVVCTGTVSYMFAKVLGINTGTVQASAVAQRASVGGDAFGYAVFSGGGVAEFNGSKHVFGGSVYGRDGVSLGNDASVYGDVICTSSGSVVRGNGSSISGTVDENHAAISMPDFSAKIKEQGIVVNSQAEFDALVNGKTVDGPIYVNGNITINGRVKGSGIIYASGTITFLNDNIVQTNQDSIVFYAQQGDITFNGGSGTVIGILYAPNGTVRVNGAPNSTIYGRVIGKYIDFNGAKASVYASANDLLGLEKLSSIKLVQ